MRVQGALISLALVGLLAGCAAAPKPVPSDPTPSPDPTPDVRVAPIGEAAIPLGCRDLLADADVADLGHPTYDPGIRLSIAEDLIAVDLTVADLQRGALRCSWASRYGATDLHAEVDVRIAPSTATEIDIAAEPVPFGTHYVAVDGVDDTVIACTDSFVASSDDPTLLNQCTIVQLRGGYRVDLLTDALRASAGNDPSVALRLLAAIDAAIDGADPARTIVSGVGTTEPAALCRAPEITPLLDYVGATGEPRIEPDADHPGVTRCTWESQDEYGNPAGPRVSVLPGGAWAIPALGAGVANIFIPSHPSADGSFVIGNGDGITAWRSLGDDLVYFVAAAPEAGGGWDAFLEATW